MKPAWVPKTWPRSCSTWRRSRPSHGCWLCRTGCWRSGRRCWARLRSIANCFSKPCWYSGQACPDRARIERPDYQGICMSLPPNLGPRNGILSLTIKDKSVLYAAYMPFIKNGGLFIPTNKVYRLGDEVFMLLNLMDEQEKIPVAGKVIWITPKGAQGNRAAGIGVQFGVGVNTARNKIETYLAGALKSARPTHTM